MSKNYCKGCVFFNPDSGYGDAQCDKTYRQINPENTKDCKDRAFPAKSSQNDEKGIVGRLWNWAVAAVFIYLGVRLIRNGFNRIGLNEIYSEYIEPTVERIKSAIKE